jgi:acid phosphatase (class A)
VIRRFVSFAVLSTNICAAFTCMGVAQAQNSNDQYPPPYMLSNQLPDGLKLLPVPPADQSAVASLDHAISYKMSSLRGTPRWELAISDADLSFPHSASVFSCALGVSVNDTATPTLYRLLRRSSSDAWAVTSRVKEAYYRRRPLLVNGRAVCTPAERDHLTKSSSFPSNHSAIGWAWALILAEIAPERADAILARGLAFGESRVICNVHWQSDVNAGALAGTAAVALMHTNPQFLTDLNTSKAEVAASRAQGDRPTPDCLAEDRAMAMTPSH